MLPLTGVKVVELANNIAGPYAAYILAMLGADVLKVERPESGDDARGWGPPFWKDTSATFHALNVNKQGVTLDLKAAEHVAWLQGYIESCDVLLHNMRPGVLDEMGLGAEALRARNPRLVYCSLSAFGPKGPMQKNGGYEPMVQAFSGLFSVNGYPDRPGVRIGTSVLDLGSAVWAALGCIAGAAAAGEDRQGLRRRRLALRDGAGAADRALRPLPGQRHPARAASERLLAVVLFQAVDTADGQVIVAAANDRLWAKFSAELGHPEWAQGRALQDQRRPLRQQGRAGGRGDGDHAPAAERGVGGAAAEGGRALRAHQRHHPHEGACADRGARHGAAGAGDRPRPDEPAAVVRRRAPDHPHPRAQARRAQRRGAGISAGEDGEALRCHPGPCARDPAIHSRPSKRHAGSR